MASYRKCLIKSGHTTWLRMEDGSMRDMGSLQGDDLVAHAVANRLPILRSVSDVAMFDGKRLHLPSGKHAKKR